MANPLNTLRKMLTLEEDDYHFQDKAVAGGLVRYAATWRRQAQQAFGAAREDWIEDIAEKMEAYSSLDSKARPEALRALRNLLSEHAEQVETPTSSEPPKQIPERKPEPEPKPEPKPESKSGPAPRSEPEQEDEPAPEVVKVPLDDPSLMQPTTTLRGVGTKRAQLLAKLDVHTLRDMLFLYPRRHEDYSTFKTIDHLEYGERVSLLATVWEAGGRRTRSGKYLFRAILSDETGTIEVTWFNQPYLEGRIKAGMQILVRGKVDEYLGRLTMNAPEWQRIGRDDLASGRIEPVYPLTEGVSPRWMRKLVRRVLEQWAGRLEDPLPRALRREHDLLTLERALWGVHFPDDIEHLEAAKRRMTFEEAMYLQLGLLRQKRYWTSQSGEIIEPLSDYLDDVIAALPYQLTGAQKRSLKEMLDDLVSGRPMNRLLQGDVGAGKTVVAAVLMAVTASQGYQAALMAPTEILAEQHYQSLSKLFERFPEPRPNLRLLTGSVTGEEREEIYAGLKGDTIQVVVGTHALIQEQVEFANLELVIIDEQHRFGVEQRAALRQKGYNPHLLVMTATPIPRSLALTVWGHLDVSVLDEMPPGRKPVETKVITESMRERAYTFIRRQAYEGHQAFMIYPLVEESENVEARAAVVEYEHLQEDIFPELRLGLLHGRMPAEEKEQVMADFAAAELDILVATSVVEVGIDVPNATVMLIDGAERFGLAQLHQFRGRVGRGDAKSYCLLLARTSSEDATERLTAMESTNDGFVLAEKDLQMRGPGEFLGTRQSGLPELPLAMRADISVLREVRRAAASLLDQDPELSEAEHRYLGRRVTKIWNAENGEGDVS
jgi:ATP-dependent DNA helicase RecG